MEHPGAMVSKTKPGAAPNPVVADCWTRLGMNSGPGPTLLKLSDVGMQVWRNTVEKHYQEGVSAASGPERDQQLAVLHEARRDALSCLQEEADEVHWLLRD